MQMLEKQKQKSGILINIVLLTFFLSNLSYIPYFTTKGMTQLLSYPMWGILVFYLVVKRRLYLVGKDKGFLLYIAFILLLLLTFSVFAGKTYSTSLLTRCIMIAIVISIVGEMVSYSQETYFAEKSIFKAYILASIILCVIIYFSYLQGQDFSSAIYVYGSKNEASFLAASSFVMVLYYDHFDDIEESERTKLFRFLVAGFLFIMVSLMRCRQMMIAMLAVLLVFFLQKNTSKYIKLLLVIVFAIMVILIQDNQFYNTFINGIVFAGRDRTSIDSLSSGRITEIRWALEQLSNNLFTGTGDTHTVDCFFISVFMQYGIIVGSLITVLALFPLIYGITYYRRSKDPLALILILCHFSYFIGGIFEENAPFGPGIRCYISWFLYGYLKMKERNMITVNEESI